MKFKSMSVYLQQMFTILTDIYTFFPYSFLISPNTTLKSLKGIYTPLFTSVKYTQEKCGQNVAL